MARSVGLLVAMAMLAAACEDAGSPSTELTTSMAPTPDSSTAIPTTSTSFTVSPDTLEAVTTTTSVTTSTAATTVALPDPPTPVPTSGPQAGSVWWVVGVPADDVLNVRAQPGATEAIVSTLDADGGAVVATGEARLVVSSLWWEVDIEDDRAWVNARYLGALAGTWDITSWLVERAGDIPVAGSMDELVEKVLALRGGGDATMIHAGLSADGMFGEAALDVFTGPDDSIRGERLRVFGQRIDAGGPFGLYAVEATPICWRGVDQTGLCV